MRAEIGEHAYRSRLAPLEFVGAGDDRLTFRAASRCHRNHVAGRYVSRMEPVEGWSPARGLHRSR